ncbi:MAG: selenide, water dikinase SelD [Bacteroidota bacterium]
MNTNEPIRLTQYSHGAGCGCKISPQVLDKILHTSQHILANPDLLVGNDTRDDAAVYDLGDGTAIISTTDFFMPIVDDPFDFGRIASVNAISDVYAMGGSPMMAIAILGWPVDKLPPEAAQQVLEGSRSICAELGIPLAGGHSIDSPEPIFGLAVTGRVNVANIRKNGGAVAGGKLFLTKPLGVGILSTAQKQQKLQAEHQDIARDSMVQLNQLGETFAKYAYVKSMTDVTGFGLLGHLGEMCQASKTSALVKLDKVPKLPHIDQYIEQGCIPGGTHRNYESYGDKISELNDYQKAILCDPQTSGGLLIAVMPGYDKEFIALTTGLGLALEAIGEMTEPGDLLIQVE